MWWLISQLPYRIQLILARPFGWLMLLFGRRRRHIALRNLQLCFPDRSDAEHRRLLRENFYSTAMAFFETGIAWFWSRHRLRRLFTVEGLEHLEASKGQGVLLMAMHFTTLDIGASFMSICCSIDGMYRPHRNLVYDFIQHRGRGRHNPESDPMPRNDIRAMMRALKKGRVVWYAPDQDYGRKRSVFVPFFGIEAASVTATAKFSLLGNARVIPFTHTRLAGGKGYKVTVYPPLENFPCGDDRADARRINAFVEARILEHPQQYMWVHRRFKSRPPGAEDLYGLPPKHRTR